MKSIIQSEKECYLCGATLYLEEHHIFLGRKHRSLAEEDGLKVWLCAKHHRLDKNSVHQNVQLRTELQKIGEMKYLETHTFSEWMQRYGKNYLDEWS